MTCPRMPCGFEPPALCISCVIEAVWAQTPPRQRERLDLKGPQDRLLGARPACLPPQALLMVAEGIRLAAARSEDFHPLRRRQVQGRGDQEAGRLLAGPLHDKDVYGDLGTTDRPTAPELCVLKPPRAAIRPRQAALPGRGPVGIRLRRGDPCPPMCVLALWHAAWR
jgi:hypothetical protein